MAAIKIEKKICLAKLSIKDILVLRDSKTPNQCYILNIKTALMLTYDFCDHGETDGIAEFANENRTVTKRIPPLK